MLKTVKQTEKDFKTQEEAVTALIETHKLNTHGRQHYSDKIDQQIKIWHANSLKELNYSSQKKKHLLLTEKWTRKKHACDD